MDDTDNPVIVTDILFMVQGRTRDECLAKADEVGNRILNMLGGEPWVMRRRTQAEMDQLVERAGFRKVAQRINEEGLFTVSLAGIVTPLVIGYTYQSTGSFVGPLIYIGVVALIGASASRPSGAARRGQRRRCSPGPGRSGCGAAGRPPSASTR